ncbi:head-tail connector protein [Rhodoferax ferrireducens]|uniref:head-tail connector protein n=1 Tax=Rhodoferax ferrireducens TaxID=192843 RepID=UPI00298E4A87|nr:head-tail connector protein [Rhodoferax ferrireducens]WPC65275.1 head-tail connector protein [Rhodoferax ferrireducens]
MLTLTEAKLHLRVDGTDDDTLITSLIAAATAATANHLDNASLVMDATAPAPIKSAALLLIADLYENREAQTERQLFSNATFDRLLQPYRVLTA